LSSPEEEAEEEEEEEEKKKNTELSLSQRSQRNAAKNKTSIILFRELSEVFDLK